MGESLMGFYDDMALDADLLIHVCDIYRGVNAPDDAGGNTRGTAADPPAPVFRNVPCLCEEHDAEDADEAEEIVVRVPFTVYFGQQLNLQVQDLIVWKDPTPNRTIVVRNTTDQLTQGVVWKVPGYERTP